MLLRWIEHAYAGNSTEKDEKYSRVLMEELRYI